MNALNDVIQGCTPGNGSPRRRTGRGAAAEIAAFSVGAASRTPLEKWQGYRASASKCTANAAVHGWCIGGAYVIVQ
jgi:hypothetical protein